MTCHSDFVQGMPPNPEFEHSCGLGPPWLKYRLLRSFRGFTLTGACCGSGSQPLSGRTTYRRV